MECVKRLNKNFTKVRMPTSIDNYVKSLSKESEDNPHLLKWGNTPSIASEIIHSVSSHDPFHIIMLIFFSIFGIFFVFFVFYKVSK